jgi:hypothetical protein
LPCILPRQSEDGLMQDFEVCLFLCPGEDAVGWGERCAAIETYARGARACGLSDLELQEDIMAFWPTHGMNVEVTTGLDRTICIYLIASL